jgi:tetratricopeptide (TPR) repeat protein
MKAFRAEWIEKDYFVLAQFEDVLKTATPLDKALIYRYAGIYERALLKKAVEAALSALDTEPDRYEALMTLGTAYMRLERIDDAVRYVEQAAERYPQRAAIWSLLGQLALARQDVEAAARHFAKAISMEPSNASYLYNYGWLLDQTDRDSEAAPYYERAIASSSLSFEAMNNLALIEAAGDRSHRALILLNRAVVSNPQNEAAYLNRGNYYAKLGLWRNAIEDYAHARRLNPLSGYAFVESARAHLELDRADIAIDELSAALDVDPHLEEAYVLLSSAYEKQGRGIESAAALREASRVRERR